MKIRMGILNFFKKKKRQSLEELYNNLEVVSFDDLKKKEQRKEKNKERKLKIEKLNNLK